MTRVISRGLGGSGGVGAGVTLTIWTLTFILTLAHSSALGWEPDIIPESDLNRVERSPDPGDAGRVDKNGNGQNNLFRETTSPNPPNARRQVQSQQVSQTPDNDDDLEAISPIQSQQEDLFPVKRQRPPSPQYPSPKDPTNPKTPDQPNRSPQDKTASGQQKYVPQQQQPQQQQQQQDQQDQDQQPQQEQQEPEISRTEVIQPSQQPDILNNKRDVNRFKFPSSTTPLQNQDIILAKKPETRGQNPPPARRSSSPTNTATTTTTNSNARRTPPPSPPPPTPPIEDKDAIPSPPVELVRLDKDDLTGMTSSTPLEEGEPDDDLMLVTKGPAPLLVIANATVKCDPRDYVQRGYCQKYFTCNRKLRVEITRTCSEGLYWNPAHNSIHGGVCDYLRNVANETMTEYMKDPACPLDLVYFRSDEECSGDYFYHHPTRTGGLELRESCPKGLVWSGGKESCELCHLAKKDDGTTPCCPPPVKGESGGGDDYNY